MEIPKVQAPVVTRIALDFNEALRENKFGLGTGLSISILLFLLALAILLPSAALLTMQLRTNSELDLLQRKATQNSTVTITSAPLAKDQLQEINQVISRLNVPWRDLFSAIEADSDSTVALLDVEPLASANVVHVTAECGRPDEMIDYLNGFKRKGYFTSVELKRHQMEVHEGTQTLRFWFDLGWPASHQSGTSP